MWLSAKRTGSRLLFIAARRSAKVAIRAFRRNQEQRLIYAKYRKDFFKYIYQRNGNIKQTISLNISGDIASDKEAAEIFKQEFTKKFSARSKLCMHLPCLHKSKESELMFNSNELTVWEALLLCSNSNSSSDGISFKLLKAISKCIIQQLNIIFQQSFCESVFPQC